MPPEDHRKNHLPWTAEEYDQIVNSLPEDEDPSEDASDNSLGQLLASETRDLLESEVSGVCDGESGVTDELCDVSFDDGVAVTLLEETEEEAVRDVHGLKSRCPFNTLASFHAVTNFPCDIMHDFLGKQSTHTYYWLNKS